MIFLKVVGCIDGTHVKVSPPKEDEESTLNHHHEQSLNILAVAGPDFQIFYANANFPGRCHDSRVLRYLVIYLFRSLKINLSKIVN